MYLVNETAEISGVSVRTLHYYDQIDLLSPSKADNQYRYYTDADFQRLQMILFYKYLGFSLKEIKELLSQSQDKTLDILQQQLNLLNKEKQKINAMIQTLENTIQSSKGEINMSNQEKFEGFNFNSNDQYKDEAIEKYGIEVVEDSYKKAEGNEQVMTDGMNDVFSTMANNLQQGISFEDDSTHAAAGQLWDLLNKYSFDCSLDVFSMIGQGYVADERFTKNIDQFGTGTAEYTNNAIQHFVKMNK